MRARAKLLAIEAAGQLNDLRVPPGNRLEALLGDRPQGNTAFASTNNGVSVSSGAMAKHGRSRSSTTIKEVK